MLFDVSEDSVRSAPDFWDWATRVVPAVYTNVKYNQASKRSCEKNFPGG